MVLIMATYKPLFMYVSPASVPQIVAHIQKYLADNPIVSDPEAIAEVIQQYIEEHPEIIAVASVNGKTGNVVLTGSDININASSAVTIETQLLNLASMIASAGSNISQIQAQLETIYTNISTLDGKVAANETAIDSLETSVSGQGTRLAAAETDIDNLETAQTALGTRINTAEGNISSLQTRMMQAETDIDNNESSIETLNTNIRALQTDFNNFVSTGTWAPVFQRVNVASVGFANYVKIGKIVIAKAFITFGTSVDQGNIYLDGASLPFASSVIPIGVFGIGRTSVNDLNATMSTGSSNNNVWISRGDTSLRGNTVNNQEFTFELIYFVS